MVPKSKLTFHLCVCVGTAVISNSSGSTTEENGDTGDGGEGMHNYTYMYVRVAVFCFS